MRGSEDRSGIRQSGVFRSQEAAVALLGVLGLFGLVALQGPLRTSAPEVLLGITTGLFFVPGLALTYLLLGRGFSFAFRIPLALFLSVGVFGFPAVPALLAHWTLDGYIVVCAILFAFSIVLLVLLALRRRDLPRPEDTSEGDDIRWWMWVPLVFIGGVLALISATGNLSYGNDQWIYLGYVRDFLEQQPGGLGLREPFYAEPASFNRIYMSGWILEQSALSRLSGLSPVSVVTTYLPPVVQICAVAAYYFVAKAILVKARPVLIATVLSVLFPFFHYLRRDSSPDYFDGNSFVGITIDKTAIHFVFLPVAIGLAVLFLRERRWRHLVLFSLACGTMLVVHPIGLVVLCFALAGMGAGYLLFNLRDLSAWSSLTVLALAPAVIVLPVTGYILSTGTSLIELRGSLANYYSTDTSAIGYLSVVSGVILQLEDGSFVLNPRGSLNPLNLGGLVGAIVFLGWRVRHSLAAQMILGLLLFTLSCVYFPPLSNLIGTYIGPSQLVRLYWSVELVVPLTLGWMVSDLLKFVSERVRPGWFSRTSSLPTSGLLAFVTVAGLSAFTLVSISPGVAAHIAQANEPPPRTCLDPVYRWLGRTIDAPSVVLASDRENSCIPVYSADANVVSVRNGVLRKLEDELERVSSEEIEIPERALEAKRFAESTKLDEDLARLIQRTRADYVLVGRRSLKADIERKIDSGNKILMRTNSPKSSVYKVYEVNQKELDAYLEAGKT